METEKNHTEFIIKINSGMIALTSIVLTIVAMFWNAFYGYGKLAGKMDSMQDDIKEIKERITKVDGRLDRLEDEFHKMDIRVTKLEERKP